FLAWRPRIGKIHEGSAPAQRIFVSKRSKQQEIWPQHHSSLCEGQKFSTRTPAEPFRETPKSHIHNWVTRKTATGKQPYALTLADRGIMALAGLWETGTRRPASGFAASRSSPRSRTNCAPKSIIACR